MNSVISSYAFRWRGIIPFQIGESVIRKAVSTISARTRHARARICFRLSAATGILCREEPGRIRKSVPPVSAQKRSPPRLNSKETHSPFLCQAEYGAGLPGFRSVKSYSPRSRSSTPRSVRSSMTAWQADVGTPTRKRIRPSATGIARSSI